jgi:hypothetical protein
MLNLNYFQAHVDMYQTVLGMYENTHSKPVAEAYKKELQHNLPPKPKVKQSPTNEKIKTFYNC